MIVPAKIHTGQPDPFGCTALRGFNFAVHSPGQTGLNSVCSLWTRKSLSPAICCQGKTGQVWHGFLPDLTPDLLYGYRIARQAVPGNGALLRPDKLLIDPYAKRLNRSIIWQRRSYRQDSQFMIPKAFVSPFEAFDWQGVTSPDIPADQRILYELHVKGFTQRHPDVEEVYLGNLPWPGIPARNQLPQYAGGKLCSTDAGRQFHAGTLISEKGLTNFWGYNPVNFFCPDNRYAVLDPIHEFKTMVRELHRQGIKVILDVVFNHTAEAGLNGPTLSYKGFDNKGFYLFEHSEGGGLDYNRYMNNSGCGNSINMDNNFGLRLILDALRYWVTEMHVDGFRFDLAASLARENYEFRHSSAFFRSLKQDPTLSTAIIIAEPWDLGQGGYRLGHFPVNWQECNDKYRDRVRSFWRGDKTGWAILPPD